MVKYTLDVQDHPRPESRLVFLRRLEMLLKELKDSKIIDGYGLSTSNNVTCLFKSKEAE